ncbi:MAG: DNA-deoxyinosine glycosylase [Woeseiaceae bacterium]
MTRSLPDPMKQSSGFAPIVGNDAQLLVLGTLPSIRSILAAEYYAHPRNAFWRIMAEITGASGSYEQRCDALRQSGIAVWDVLASSVRPGSLDADIDMNSATVNDFDEFLTRYSSIECLCFNGQKAAKIFASRVSSVATQSHYQLTTLPSTSPAYAAMSFEEKLARWRAAIEISVKGKQL